MPGGQAQVGGLYHFLQIKGRKPAGRELGRVEARAELAAALLASLDGEPEEAVEAAWAAEIQRRVERVRSGEAKGRPWPEVRERLERRRERANASSSSTKRRTN